MDLIKIIDKIKQYEGFSEDIQVASLLKMTKENLHGYKKRNKIPYAQIIDYAKNSEVSIDWLLSDHPFSKLMKNGENSSRSLLENFVMIPRYDVVASGGQGVFQPDQEQIIESLPFKESWIREELRMNPKDLAMIRLEGDSMTPLLDDGDTILVNINYNKMVADGIYVVNMTGTLRVKKLQLLLSDQKILVQSINPNYQDETLDDTENLVIVGKVCWVGKMVK